MILITPVLSRHEEGLVNQLGLCLHSQKNATEKWPQEIPSCPIEIITSIQVVNLFDWHKKRLFFAAAKMLLVTDGGNC